MSTSRFAWGEIRERYENGELTRDLAQAFCCSRRSIELHAKTEGWTRPLDWNQKRSRMVASDGRGDLEEITPLTAGEILQRHQRDWGKLRPLCDEAIRIARSAQNERALKAARLVRLLVAGLKELQAGERLAWAIGPNDQPPEIDDTELEEAIQEAAARLAQQRRGDGASPTVH